MSNGTLIGLLLNYVLFRVVIVYNIGKIMGNNVVAAAAAAATTTTKNNNNNNNKYTLPSQQSM